jgi:hypothetical protein
VETAAALSARVMIANLMAVLLNVP